MQFLAYASEQALQYSEVATPSTQRHECSAGNDKEGGGLAMTPFFMSLRGAEGDEAISCPWRLPRIFQVLAMTKKVGCSQWQKSEVLAMAKCLTV